MLSLSIIIPVYNVERYLSACLESVIKQSLEDYEVIIIDDGSTDGSGIICDKYKVDHQEFRVIHQENKGLSISRNLGISEAKGKYLMFLDSDDFLVPRSITDLLRLADDNNLEILGYKSVEVQANNIEPIIKKQFAPKSVELTSGLEYMANNNFIPQVWWYIVRRDLIINNDILFPVGHMLEDAAFNLRLFSKAKRMAYVPNVVYCYRIHSESITHNRNNEHQQKLMWDFLYAANDVGKVLKDLGNEMGDECYDNCRSRRDSYVFFGAIRAFKLGMVQEYIDNAKSQDLYPFKRMRKKDYPSSLHSIIYWCISRPRIWKALSSLYQIIKR